MSAARNWRELAACRDVVTHDYDPFFADEHLDPEAVTEALEICAGCEVKAECLDFAVRTGQRYGVWGGYPRRELRRLVEATRSGRSIGELPRFNAFKDRCKRGHRFTKANTYYDPSGRRHCRACRRAAERRASQARRWSA